MSADYVNKKNCICKGEIKLFYRLKGIKNGELIIFVHGNDSNSKAWACQQTFFASRYLTLAIDMRGFGHSSHVGPYTAEVHSEDLHYLLQRLNLLNYPFILVGWSAGGICAQSYALTYPKEVKKLVLVDTAPKIVQTPEFPYGRTQASEDELVAGILNNFPQYAIEGSLLALPEICPGITKVQEYLTKDILKTGKIVTVGQTLGDAEFNSLNQLANIQIPTLIMVGLKDVVINPQCSIYMNLQIPNSQLKEFPKAGHAPFWTFCEEFNKTLLQFIHDQYSCQICTELFV